MLEEIELDINNNRLFISKRLNEEGQKNYPSLLKEAVKNGDEESLELNLVQSLFFNTHETIQNGQVKSIPRNASKLLCQSEFNRFYIRGICRRAQNERIDQVEIYRGRESSQKRPESEAKIGTFLDATALLEDLRSSIGKEPKLLPEINSGLTVKI